MAKLTFRLTSSESLDFPLNEAVTRLGRNPGNEIVIDNSWISSFHAEFRRSAETLFLRDLNSSNGTSVNGAPVVEQLLKDGDRIAFGQLEAFYDAETLPSAMVSVVPVPPTPLSPKPLAASPVVPRQMTPPAASIAYDTVRKEGSLELEALQKKLTEATGAAEKAVQAKALAEAGLDQARLAQETARKVAQAEAELLASKQEEAAAAVSLLKEEITVLTAQREACQRAMAEAATSAESTVQNAQAAAVELLQARQAFAMVRQEQEEAAVQLVAAQEELQRHRIGIQQVQETLASIQQERDSLLAARDAAAAERAAAEEAKGAALRVIDSETLLARASRDLVLAQTATAKAAREEAEMATARLIEELAPLRQEAGLWAEREAGAKSALAEIQQQLTAARESIAAEELERSARLREMGEVELQLARFAGQITQWEEQEAVARRVAAVLKVDQAAAEACRQDLLASQERLAASDAALAETASRQVSVLAEIQAGQARLELLRRETEGAESLHGKVTDLRQQQAEAERRLEFLDDRLAGMSEAPDPNWGTVHSLARSFIRKLDLIDDLLAHLAAQPEATGTRHQLVVFRAGLLDILKEYSIEAYSLEPGTIIDVAARKRIQIVETLSEGAQDGTRVVRTYRPGYVCLNGDLGISTLLRKADVAVSIPVG